MCQQTRRNTFSIFIFLFLLVTLSGITHPARAETYSSAPADCGTPATLISTIQGSGASSPEIGSMHTIEGIVIGDFQTSNGLAGFFVQEETTDHDADPTTSDGKFIYDGDSPATDVSAGDLVRLTGEVTEYYGLTEVVSYSSKTICSSGHSISPATLNMPETTLDTWEQHEGMLIHIPQTLHVTRNAFQGRPGEVLLSAAGRLFTTTIRVEPGSAANARQIKNDLNLIQLDDGSTTWYLDPTPYLGQDNTL